MGEARGRPALRLPAAHALGAFLAIVVPAGAVAQRPVPEVIDSLARAEFNARPTAGLEVAVVKAGRPLFWRSWGSADLEHDVPLDREAVFQIASVTKEFTAAAVMKLVEEGKIDLDDDIRRYLPEIDTHGHTVKIRHLLNHTSGLRNIYEMSLWPRIYPMRLLRPEARAYELEGVAEDSLDFVPGTHYHYSNTGYDFLGDLVEKVTGEDVETYYRRVLFEPLGLDRTSFCPWTRVLPNRAWGYEPDSTGTFLENARRQSQGVLHTSGGICSSAPDLLRWNDALHQGRVVSAASYRAMTTPEGASSTYGFGLFIRSLEGHRRIEHNGYTPGFSSQLEYYPDETLSIVVLANSSSAVRGLAEDIARAVLGVAPRAVPVRPVGWSVQALDPSADTTDIDFVTMGSGMHVTGGPGAMYWEPSRAAEGDFSLEVDLHEGMGAPDPDEGHGILFGGRALRGGEARYLAFLVRRSGEYALIRQAGRGRETLVPWTANDLARAGEMSENSLSVRVSGSTVTLAINGAPVRELSTSELGGTDGLVGLWIGAGYDVHVSSFTAGESPGPASSPSPDRDRPETHFSPNSLSNRYARETGGDRPISPGIIEKT